MWFAETPVTVLLSVQGLFQELPVLRSHQCGALWGWTAGMNPPFGGMASLTIQRGLSVNCSGAFTYTHFWSYIIYSNINIPFKIHADSCGY